MKKIFTIILLILFTFVNQTTFVFAKSNTNKFVVTAYYSPLPNQNYYLKGNYKDELRLNGMGIAGASGKKVFSGMLAAPKNYKFGTKIYIEGLGIGSVEDRGGAIVNAGSRGYGSDRIDVWMGYGDEGLRRALYWGKRTVTGNIVSYNSKTNINLYNVPSPLWATKNLYKIPNIFNFGLGKNSDSNLVSKLQNFLKDINLYEGKIDGIYNNSIIDLVYDFQIENNLIKSGEYYGAGYWGSKTRSLFLKKYKSGEFNKKNNIKNNDIKGNEIIKNKSNNKEKEIVISNDLEIFNYFGKSINEIKILQKTMQDLALYNGKITGKYSDLIDPIYDFQISQKIVNSPYSPGAGSYGPKTRSALKNIYLSYQKKLVKENIQKEKEELLKKQEQEKKIELTNKYNELNKLALSNAKNKINNINLVKFGSISPQVRELQLLLKDLGYFNYKDTAIFGNITKDSIISFQIKNNVIESKKSIGAGIFGNKTKNKLIEILHLNNLENLIIKEKINKDDLVDIGILSI